MAWGWLVSIEGVLLAQIALLYSAIFRRGYVALIATYLTAGLIWVGPALAYQDAAG